MNAIIKVTPSVIFSDVADAVGPELDCGRLTLMELVEKDLPVKVRTEAAEDLKAHYGCFDVEVMSSGNVRLTRTADDIPD